MRQKIAPSWTVYHLQTIGLSIAELVVAIATGLAVTAASLLVFFWLPYRFLLLYLYSGFLDSHEAPPPRATAIDNICLNSFLIFSFSFAAAAGSSQCSASRVRSCASPTTFFCRTVICRQIGPPPRWRHGVMTQEQPRPTEPKPARGHLKCRVIIEQSTFQVTNAW